MEPYTLPDLPYDYNALEPSISAQIMELHHGKHHATYVKGANQALDQLAAVRSTGEMALVGPLERTLAFNLSGHVLHSLFWTSMSPNGGGGPKGALASRIDQDFGSLDWFRRELTTTATTIQGSGWGALVWEPVGQRLLVVQIHDHQSDTVAGSFPLLVVDGWEHAYYLDYQNDKQAWLQAFWEVADWEAVGRRFENCTSSSLALV